MMFTDAFAYVVGEEGKLSMDPEDSGNWTGGKIGLGVLKGTKYGVSAAAYPSLDIANLTLADAQAIAKRDYWDRITGDNIPYGTALSLFDFGYNAGVGEAVRVAQRALGLTVDGVIGPMTKIRLVNEPVPVFAQAFRDARIAAYKLMPGWAHDGDGWTARANLTCQKAMGLA
jgi:lysozyme family protein